MFKVDGKRALQGATIFKQRRELACRHVAVVDTARSEHELAFVEAGERIVLRRDPLDLTSDSKQIDLFVERDAACGDIKDDLGDDVTVAAVEQFFVLQLIGLLVRPTESNERSWD